MAGFVPVTGALIFALADGVTAAATARLGLPPAVFAAAAFAAFGAARDAGAVLPLAARRVAPEAGAAALRAAGALAAGFFAAGLAATGVLAEGFAAFAGAAFVLAAGFVAALDLTLAERDATEDFVAFTPLDEVAVLAALAAEVFEAGFFAAADFAAVCDVVFEGFFVTVAFCALVF